MSGWRVGQIKEVLIPPWSDQGGMVRSMKLLGQIKSCVLRWAEGGALVDSVACSLANKDHRYKHVGPLHVGPANNH